MILRLLGAFSLLTYLVVMYFTFTYFRKNGRINAYNAERFNNLITYTSGNIKMSDSDKRFCAKYVVFTMLDAIIAIILTVVGVIIIKKIFHIV